MKKLTILFSLMLLCLSAQAADPVYLFEKFTDAEIYFADNTFAKAKVNYELTEGIIQYIQDGELMEVPEENTITYIKFPGNRTFYQREPLKFYEQVHNANGDVMVYWKLTEVSLGNQGAYGTTTQAGTTAVRLSTLPGGGTQVGDWEHPVFQKDVYKQKCENTYLFTIKGKNYKIKTLKNIYKSFSAKQAEIKQYIEENKLTMSSAEMALQIINFIQGL